MAKWSTIISVIVVLVAVIVGIDVYISQPWTLSEDVFKDKYFGSKDWKEGDAIPKDDESIHPFKVSVSDDILSDLEERLNRSRIPEPLPGVNFNYGFNPETLKKVVNYWQTKYDWRQQEKLINKYPHFKTQIEGLNIHFVHVKPSIIKSKPTVPIILIHGWPGSFIEFMKIIPFLTDATNDDISFEIIIPSIPGYGFSDASKRRPLLGPDYSRIFNKLMNRLGHEKYFVHGYDFGFFISKFMSVMFPDKILGFHSTQIVGRGTILKNMKYLIANSFPSLIYEDANRDYQKMHPFIDKVKFVLQESGYLHLMVTKPDTIGISLNDSPIGLASYILSMFAAQTNLHYVDMKDGGMFDIDISMDDMISNVMIYWVTQTITTSMRSIKDNVWIMNDIHNYKTSVPTAISCFKNELFCYPQVYVKDMFPNIVQYLDHDFGGHYAAFERPQVVASEISSFASKVMTDTK